MTFESLSIIILSYNRCEELICSLPSICCLSVEMGFELIVVDNASNDGTRELLSKIIMQFPNLKVILNEKNLGVAEGRNTGWRAATGDYILNIDDDTRIGELEIAALYYAAIARPDVAVISPRIIHAASGAPQNDHGAKEYYPANFHGACHLVRADVYKKVGAIDTFCSFGGEELDYSIRVRSAGYNVLYIPHVTVYHNNFVRKGNESIWRRQQWLYNFSRIHFKHFPIYIAFLFTLRYFLSHFVSCMLQHGLIIGLSMPRQVIKGAIEGMRQYNKIPDEVKYFYTDRYVRPDFGNVPIYKKIFQMIARK